MGLGVTDNKQSQVVICRYLSFLQEDSTPPHPIPPPHGP